MVIFSYLNPKLVQGWRLVGSTPEKYEVGEVFDEEKNRNVSYLGSVEKDTIEGFGALSKTIEANDYLGKRLKLSADLKSKEVKGWAGIWIRINGAKQKVLFFENMQERPVKGTNSWSKYEIIFDVPQESLLISYGLLISGNGKVWIDDIRFESAE